MSNDKAVEVSQLSQPAPSTVSKAGVGYYEPQQPADLAQQGRLYVVANPLTNSGAGQLACQYAIQKILHRFYSTKPEEPQAHLLATIEEVNADLLARNTEHSEQRVISVALTVAWVHESKLLVANVGDNRTYVVWDQDIEWLNHEIDPSAKDETNGDKQNEPLLLPARVEPSPESPQTAAKSEATPRQRLVQGLGVQEKIDIRLYTRRLFAGDILVMCSGGLTGYLNEADIAKIVNRYPPDEAVKQMVAQAQAQGSLDQLALSVVKILPDLATTRPTRLMLLPPEPSWSKLQAKFRTQPPPALPPPSTPTPSPSPATPPKNSGKTDTGPLSNGKSKSATATQPLPDGPRVFGDPQLTKSFAQVFDTEGQRSRMLGGAALGLVLLCVAMFLLLQLIPAGSLASVPVLGDLARSIQGEEAAQPPAIVLTATGSPAANGPTATVPAASAAIVESDSPVPTPEDAAFASSVGTPTAQTTALAQASAGDEVDLPPTPTPLPTIELPAGCENRARFFRDVTVPDGTVFSPGESFEKVWLLSNANTCPWGPGYTVQFMEGDRLGANPVWQFTEVVPPETNGEIRIPMKAPVEPGSYRGVWQMHNIEGAPFGPEIYLEIEVVGDGVAAAPDPADVEGATTLYDFVQNVGDARWTSGDTTYSPLASRVTEALELPPTEGLVASGVGLLRGNQESDRPVLLTYPHRELGFIEGIYPVDEALQPTDALAATLGYPKLSILSDDGVTFEVIFTPNDGSDPRAILSTNVQYPDSPVSDTVSLSNIEPGQTGTFTLRVLGGDSLRQDWAVWIDLRLIRPE